MCVEGGGGVYILYWYTDEVIGSQRAHIRGQEAQLL